MLQDLIYHRDYMLRESRREKEKSNKMGEPESFFMKAAGRIYPELDVSNIDAALACLEFDFHEARLALQRRESDDAMNAAAIELEEISLAVNVLLENVFFDGGAQAEEIEGE